MRSMIVRLRNSRIEFWLGLATFALWLYTFFAQRRTNIHTLCKIDSVATIYGSGHGFSSDPEDVALCIGMRQNDLIDAWVGPFAWATLVTVVVMGMLMGVLYGLAEYTNWLGRVAGLRPIAYFKCGCSTASCEHCQTGLYLNRSGRNSLNFAAAASADLVSSESEAPRADKPWSLFRFFPRGSVKK